MMCERKYSEEHGEILSGFCSDECKNVYSHVYGFEELSKPLVEC
jgi:hypothetical protein